MTHPFHFLTKEMNNQAVCTIYAGTQSPIHFADISSPDRAHATVTKAVNGVILASTLWISTSTGPWKQISIGPAGQGGRAGSM